MTIAVSIQVDVYKQFETLAQRENIDTHLLIDAALRAHLAGRRVTFANLKRAFVDEIAASVAGLLKDNPPPAGEKK